MLLNKNFKPNISHFNISALSSLYSRNKQETITVIGLLVVQRKETMWQVSEADLGFA